MIEAAAYCREVEAYLCRKNEGHLIRIVGPVFEQVSGWAAQGVPLAVVFRGIDRFCERYYAKGPRRRPVRIEFCEADILELFDDWRRAVGVRTGDADSDAAATKRDSLPAHLDRAINRLTALRAGGRSAGFDQKVSDAVRELDAARALTRHARGEARAAFMARLRVLDRDLMEAAREEVTPERRKSLHAEAELEIAPFAPRMEVAARTRAIETAYERLLREAVGLPTLTPEP